MKIAGLFVLAAVCASAQPSGRFQDLEAIFSDYDLVELNPSDIDRQVKDFGGSLAIEIEGQQFVFQMERRDLRSQRYRAEATGDDGLRRPLPLDEVNTYKGTVIGRPDIQGRFNITSDSFDGVIFTPGDWRYVEPLRNYLPDSEPSEMVIYRQSDITHGSEFSCGASSLHHFQDHGTPKIDLEPHAIDFSTEYTVEVATEADYEFFNANFRSANSANRKIMSILNRIEGVYERELALKLEVVYQHVWETREDPYSATTGNELLNEFRDYWKYNLSHESRDLAHLWTGKNLGDAWGRAWVGNVCRFGADLSYGFSRYSRAFPAAVGFILAAHEIGHNFGANHTDEEDPPIPPCHRTIMESKWFPDTELRFCGFSKIEIRRHVTQFNSCFPEAVPSPPPPPTVTILAPSSLTAEVINSTMVRLEWQDNSNNELGFAIERKGTGEKWSPAQVAEALIGQNRTAYADIGLDPETSYDYRVAAFDVTALSPYSNTVAAITPATGTAADKPCGDQKLLDVEFTLRAVKHPTFFSGDPRFKVEVPDDAAGLLVSLKSLTPDVDVDLHVNHGSFAKLVDGIPNSDYSSESYTGNEAIHITAMSDPPLRPGTYYFSVSLHTTGKQTRVNLSAKLER